MQVGETELMQESFKVVCRTRTEPAGIWEFSFSGPVRGNQKTLVTEEEMPRYPEGIYQCSPVSLCMRLLKTEIGIIL